MPASVRAFTVRLCSVQVVRTKERLAEVAKKSKGKKGPGGALTGDALVAALAGEVAVDEHTANTCNGEAAHTLCFSFSRGMP